MFLVGLDIVGDKLLEINVFSPGGLRSAQSFEGVMVGRYDHRTQTLVDGTWDVWETSAQPPGMPSATLPRDYVRDGYGGSGDWAAGLDGEAARFVPFNGGVGPAQLAWLDACLARPAARKVLAMGPHPFA